MFKENGKWVTYHAGLYATQADLMHVDSESYGFLGDKPDCRLAIVVDKQVQKGWGFRFNPRDFGPYPTFQTDMAATHSILTQLDQAHLDRLNHKRDEHQQHDFIQHARNYAESYFYLAKIRGEKNADVLNPLHDAFLDTSYELLAQSEMALGGPVVEELNKGLAASCVRLRELNVLKPL
jgi:hypothetical protein